MSRRTSEASTRPLAPSEPEPQMSARSLRLVVAGSLATSLVAAGSALAAPAKPACELIKDAAGDGAVLAPADDFDILTADVASNGKTITAVLRLAGDPTATNPQALGGKNYYVSFTSGGSQPQFLSASVDPVTGVTYATGFEEDVNGVGNKTSDTTAAKGSIDGNVITISAPLSAFAARTSVKPGKKLTDLTAEVFALIGTSATGGALALDDDATGGSYTTGTPSCVKPA